jgi:hypothetical protein
MEGKIAVNTQIDYKGWSSDLGVDRRAKNFSQQRIAYDSSVGIATVYGLDGRGSIPSRVKRFFSSP